MCESLFIFSSCSVISSLPIFRNLLGEGTSFVATYVFIREQMDSSNFSPPLAFSLISDNRTDWGEKKLLKHIARPILAEHNHHFRKGAMTTCIGKLMAL